ncbi:MAG: acyl-CoA dehydrogenase [SAR202 cluster bacterium]|jgi:alkylation response protein AidB-like acyl-CoA dehydrogenase|nr:acyl-CoA dehydrogenase family protein [Dehalococcoidia bacterium]MQF87853.1 acyl-CoA dehydrogenase [SAR202 cluster bacterium]|tara:strand:- start:1977 stop:3113 length:1137 start_codon:yes stop_codon:yes gene_type:complete
MDLGLTEIQQMLKTSAQDFLSRECPLTLVREMEEDPRGFTDELWRQMINLGWTGVAFPEQYGGTGGNFADLGVLLEEIGRSLAPAPFFSTVVLGGMTVLDAGSDAQKNDLISRICAGTIIMTMAVPEAAAAYEPWDIQATASQQGGGYEITGSKLFVPDAEAADVIIVAARTSSGQDPADGVSLFLVPSGTAGLTITPMWSVGNEKVFEVSLDKVNVTADSALGAVGEAWPIIERSIQRATAAQSIQMLGGAEAVLDMTVEYAKGRTQFGRAIGTFQAVQHHCARMATDVEGSKGVAFQAVWRLSEGLSAKKEVAMAKAWIGPAYRRVCATAHQCHGAIGFTKEHDLQLYTRRAKVHELTYGDANHHKEIALQHLDDE